MCTPNGRTDGTLPRIRNASPECGRNWPGRCTQSYLSNIRRLGYEREQALALAQKIIEEGTL